MRSDFEDESVPAPEYCIDEDTTLERAAERHEEDLNAFEQRIAKGVYAILCVTTIILVQLAIIGKHVKDCHQTLIDINQPKLVI